MAQMWDEGLAELSVRWDELIKRAAVASGGAKVDRQLRREATEGRIRACFSFRRLGMPSTSVPEDCIYDALNCVIDCSDAVAFLIADAGSVDP